MPKGITEVLEESQGIGVGEEETAGVVWDVRHRQLCRRVECKLWLYVSSKITSIILKANAGGEKESSTRWRKLRSIRRTWNAP